MRLLVVEPLPSSPDELSPQYTTAGGAPGVELPPPLSAAQPCCPPAAMRSTPLLSSATGTGVALSLVPPLPRPTKDPQHWTAPFCTAQVSVVPTARPRNEHAVP